MNSSWKVQIFEQKTLWEVYFLSRRVMPRNKFNRNCVRFATVISVAFFVTMMAGGQDLYSLSDAGRFLRALANASFLFSLGILGFLIAGFAIFASVTNAKLFIMLASIPYGDGRINRLQFVFFNFLNVFTIYIALMSVALFTMIFCCQNLHLLFWERMWFICPSALQKWERFLQFRFFLYGWWWRWCVSSHLSGVCIKRFLFPLLRKPSAWSKKRRQTDTRLAVQIKAHSLRMLAMGGGPLPPLAWVG